MNIVNKKGAAALQRLSRVLKDNISGTVVTDEPLSRYTSYRLGGPADIFVTPRTIDEVGVVVQIAAEAGVPVTVIGGGSNLLIADAGVRGVVVRIGRGLNRIEITEAEELVRVECGAPFPRLAKMAAQHGLAGLEFAGGIPGTVGGALTMNAGAHADSIGDVVESVTVFDENGEQKVLDHAQMQFSYRMSRLQTETGLVAVKARLRLKAGEPKEIQRKMRAYLMRRRQSQPLGTYNAGSVFKNPVNDYAGRLLELSDCKGMTEGDAIVSPVHANFIINQGEATAEDVRRLIGRVQGRVHERFGVRLEPEVRMLGFA